MFQIEILYLSEVGIRWEEIPKGNQEMYSGLFAINIRDQPPK
jgi:hypothetical protein